MNEVVTIPTVWREETRRILLAGNTAKTAVLVPQKVFARWQLLFADGITNMFHLRSTIAEVLNDGDLKGVNVKMPGDSGEVYEFLFPMVGASKVYVKISLRLDRHRKAVYFYSAHKAEREYL